MGDGLVGTWNWQDSADEQIVFGRYGWNTTWRRRNKKFKTTGNQSSPFLDKSKVHHMVDLFSISKYYSYTIINHHPIEKKFPQS